MDRHDMMSTCLDVHMIIVVVVRPYAYGTIRAPVDQAVISPCFKQASNHDANEAPFKFWARQFKFEF